MQKKFTKNVILSMLVGMLVTVIAIFSIQHIVCTNNNISTTKVALEQVIQRLKNNEHEAATLRASLDANSIAKARAFAHMIELNPEIIKDTDEMVKIAALLDVDEVHVTDENGILYWGNIPDYYGFDFSTGEQTKPFMDILKDSSLEMAQDPQPNATKGVLFQYTSVARRDKPGIVQIGLTPQVLEDTLANNAIEKVLGAYDLGNNGYVFAIQEEDGTILAHKNNSLIGKNYKEAGFSETMISKKMGNASGKIDGIQVLYSVTEYNDMIIGIATPTSTVYTPRNEQTFVFLICSTIIFAILIINNMLKKNVIVGINQIIDNLQKITSGNLDVVTSVRNNKEFEVLSDSINTMVGSIKDGFAETEIRMEENAKILDQQQELFQQIKDISTEIKDFSEQTLSISQSINEGVLEQSNSVEDITDTMQHLSTQADQNAEISKKVSEAAYRSSERVTIANTAMGDMQEAMREIAANSEQIKTIINNIDNIAEQTNLLALNAAIEAARAGDAGRGFSVVAEQVRDLATQSTFAASETKQLIQNALTAIAKGENIASKTVEEFNEIIIDTKKVGDEIEGLVTSSKMQTETIQQATKRVAHISTVVENNTVIAEKSETTSQKLTAQAEKLNAVINS